MTLDTDTIDLPDLILQALARDLHWHQCPNQSCRHIWQHAQDPRWTKTEFDDAHTCPVCHEGRQYWKCNEFGGPWEGLRR